MFSRRDFLGRTAGAVVSLGIPLPALWRRVATAAAADPGLPALVVLELNGGNDGLNTVVPYADDIYHRSRPTLRITPEKVLKLDDHVGLHPALKDLYRLWEDGQVKVVQNVGYPNPNRSHFRSMQIWHAGVLGPAPPAGWLGRAGDATPALGRCFVGDEVVPLAVQGRKEAAAALANLADYQPALEAVVPPAGTGADALLDEIDRRMRTTHDLAARLTKLGSALPSTAANPLEGRLRMIRALLEGVPHFRVFYTLLGGFDTHAGQQFTHQDLLRTVSSAVHRFLAELRQSKLDDRVVVLIFSEFGRRLRENGQRGTDHGTAAPLFLVGKPVQGGLLGPAPDLNDLELGDPRFKIDFRDVYATVLRRWLRVAPEPILGQRDDSLALFEKEMEARAGRESPGGKDILQEHSVFPSEG
jgi:uncharacterized protein (DUF1501 family)